MREELPPAAGSDRPGAKAAWLTGSGLLDVEFHSAVRGESFASDLDAARDYIEWGMPRELPPNPFLDFSAMPEQVRGLWRRGRVRAVAAYLSSPEGLSRPYGPLFDPGSVTTPVVPGAPANPLVRFLARATPRDQLPAAWPRSRSGPDVGNARARLISAAREIASQDAATEGAMPPVEPEDFATLESALVDWDALARRLSTRAPGRTSVVVPTYQDSMMTLRAVASVLENSGDLDVEVVVVDNGSAARFGLTMAAAFLSSPAVRWLRLPQNLNFATGCNVGFSHTTGETVVFLNNNTLVRKRWLPPLLEALDDPSTAGAQPLLLYPDETIQSAGTVFLEPDLLPCHLLVGHPKEDAARVDREHLSAITGAAMALRATDVVRLRGFDPHYRNGYEDVDLCLRSLPHHPGGFRVVPSSVVTHFESRVPGSSANVHTNGQRFMQRWRGQLPQPQRSVYARLGFELKGIVDDAQAVPAARPVIGRRSPLRARTRWSINLPSTGGHWGDSWGDTQFAEALARGLRAAGQEVVTRRYGAHKSGPTFLDDVCLAIRGRHRIAPIAGKVNLLWVISHPDKVSPSEFEGFDLVYAASHVWSERMTLESGRPVLPLLQATEFGLPQGAEPVPATAASAVFVGSTQAGRHRRLIDHAIEAGVQLSVYGTGWEFLPPGVVRSEFVENEKLQELYRSQGMVLADHWPDMAREGFIANRVFDAVASGARVISDDVEGIADRFDGSLRVARTPSDLLEIRENLGTAFAATKDLAKIAREVAEEHSFAVRVRTLIEAVR